MPSLPWAYKASCSAIGLYADAILKLMPNSIEHLNINSLADLLILGCSVWILDSVYLGSQVGTLSISISSSLIFLYLFIKFIIS